MKNKSKEFAEWVTGIKVDEEMFTQKCLHCKSVNEIKEITEGGKDWGLSHWTCKVCYLKNGGIDQEWENEGEK